MKAAVITLITSLLFPALMMGGEKEEAYLREKMIPLAQEFIKKVGLPCDSQLGTNEVMKYRVDYFRDRPGCLADMRLTNNYVFHFYTEKGKNEYSLQDFFEPGQFRTQDRQTRSIINNHSLTD